MNNSRAIVMAGLALVSPLAACSSTPQNVEIGQSVGEKLADYAATWSGYAEAYDFGGGSDNLRLVLDANGQGTLTIGDAAPLPPPNSSMGYPPGASGTSVLVGLGNGLTPGFDYPVYDAKVESSRIRLTTRPHDLYRAWCEVQTPILDDTAPTPQYLCVHNWPTSSSGVLFESNCTQTNPQTNEAVPIDCAKYVACLVAPVCTCNATGCTLSGAVQGADQLDAALTNQGTELEGTLLLISPNETRLNVRMTRQ